ncbi:RNA polymerase sigma factor [Planctomycetota bacterium]
MITLESGLESQDDLSLIEKACSGDRAAFGELYTRHRQRVYYIAWKYTQDPDKAMDLVQDVFVKVFKSLDKFHAEAAFSTWLTRVATNCCIDYVRKHKNMARQGSLSEDFLNEEVLTGLYIACGEDPSNTHLRSELKAEVHKAIAGLSPKHKEVFVLYALKEYSYKDISTIVGCSEGTVMSRLFYARKYLQTALGDYLK